MFQFSGFAPSSEGDTPPECRVAPFGYARVTSCLPITAPFRSLPRPSSPLEAKASTVCPCLLSLVREIVFTPIFTYTSLIASVLQVVPTILLLVCPVALS